MTRSSGRLTRGQRLLVAVLVSAVPLVAPHAAWSADDDTPAPPRTTEAAVSAPQHAGGGDAELAQAALAAEDQRLLALVRSVPLGSGPYVQAVGAVDTLVLPPRGVGYGLPDLIALRAAEVQPDGDVLLTRDVLVAPGARLAIEAPGASLRLRSEQSGFVSLVAWKAALTLSGTDGSPLGVSSWDPGRGMSTPTSATAAHTSATSAVTCRSGTCRPRTSDSGPGEPAAWPGPAVRRRWRPAASPRRRSPATSTGSSRRGSRT